MMRKLIVIGIVAAMVMSLGVAANAFVWGISAKNATGSGSSGNLTLGNQANTTGSWTAPMGDYVALALPTSQDWLPGEDFGAWQLKNMSTAYAQTKEWKLAIWATPGFAQPATLKFWLSNSANLDVTKPWEVVDPGTKAVLALSPINTAKTSETNYMFSFTYQAPVTTDPKNGAAALLFRQQVIPEPGSMLAMLSGLVGLVGYGIRRRK